MDGHDDRRHDNGSPVGAHQGADQHEAAAGRSTLTEQLFVRARPRDRERHRTGRRVVFVMNDHSFHRRTPVVNNGKRHTNLLETLVFGHIAMRDAHGHLRPDPTRRGWVPLRVLAEAKHLEVHDVAQR